MYCPVLAAHHNKTTMWFPVRPFIFWPLLDLSGPDEFASSLLTCCFQSFYWQLRRRSLAFSTGAENRCRNICLQTSLVLRLLFDKDCHYARGLLYRKGRAQLCIFRHSHLVHIWTPFAQSLFIWKVMESIHPWPGVVCPYQSDLYCEVVPCGWLSHTHARVKNVEAAHKQLSFLFFHKGVVWSAGSMSSSYCQ